MNALPVMLDGGGGGGSLAAGGGGVIKLAKGGGGGGGGSILAGGGGGGGGKLDEGGGGGGGGSMLPITDDGKVLGMVLGGGGGGKVEPNPTTDGLSVLTAPPDSCCSNSFLAALKLLEFPLGSGSFLGGGAVSDSFLAPPPKRFSRFFLAAPKSTVCPTLSFGLCSGSLGAGVSTIPISC